MWSSDRFALPQCWIALLAILLALGAHPAHAEEVLIVTARSGTVETLSRDEAEQLYLGRRATLATRISMLLDLPPGRTRDHFYRTLTDKNPSQIRAYWSRMVFTGRALPPKEAADAGDARRLLLENPGAIGYLPGRYADDPELRILLRLE
ncbi:hypothetical protein [Thauera sp. SDU_THAU2]|uniref:hypothetical protein n=1 Tax=Thauera sp. SDU_THAU2 TaxID=3136633 RepID=UPI00311E0E6E